MKRLACVVMLLVAAAGGCDSCRQVSGQCCKVCKSSKACGDSCISRTQTCSKFGGCACNGLVEELQEELGGAP